MKCKPKRVAHLSDAKEFAVRMSADIDEIMTEDYRKKMSQAVQSSMKQFKTLGVIGEAYTTMLARCIDGRASRTLDGFYVAAETLSRGASSRIPTREMWRRACCIATSVMEFVPALNEVEGFRYQLPIDAEDKEHGDAFLHENLGFIMVYTALCAQLGMIPEDQVPEEQRKQPASRKPTKKQSEVIAELQAENARLRKELNAKEAEVRQPLQKVIAKQEKEIRRLQDIVDMYVEAEEVENAVQHGLELLDLPASGVLVVGGHTNLHQKLRASYPGWTYVGAGAKSTEFGDPEVVFCLSAHLSHSVFDKLKKYLPKDRLIMIHKVTNTTMLEQIMRYKYTLVKRGESDEKVD